MNRSNNRQNIRSSQGYSTEALGNDTFGNYTLEEGDGKNDETFGVSLADLDQEFDFSSSNQFYFSQENPNTSRPPPGLADSQGTGIELDRLFSTVSLNQAPSPPKMLSLAEVEAAMLGNLPPQEKPVLNWDQIRAERRKVREIAESKMKAYEGIMCQSDKDFITRIQLSQLVTSSQSLTLEDYYYRTFLTLKLPSSSNINVDTKDPSSIVARGKNKENQIARMQRQISKIVAESRRRQKSYPVGLENSLGKITTKSSRNPKQVLQVLHQKSSDLIIQEASTQSPSNRKPSQSPRERKRTVKTIERLYDLALEAEQLSKSRPSSDSPDEQEWSLQLERVCLSLWDVLAISEDKSPSSIVHLINIPKGKKVIPRVLRFLSQDHVLNFITVILSNLEETNVCKNGVCPPKGKLSTTILDEVELFLACVCVPIINYVNEAPLVIVNGLLNLMIEKNNPAWISRSKVGLAFLTLFLTRIEILRQSGSSLVGLMAPSPEVPLAQSVELYKHLFASLQNHFLAIFPPLSSQIEDIYVWQFLAALAVGLGLEQQHQLVLEVREKVIENVTNVSKGIFPPEIAQAKIANVNLFLHALGLDASQVNVQAAPRHYE